MEFIDKGLTNPEEEIDSNRFNGNRFAIHIQILHTVTTGCSLGPIQVAGRKRTFALKDLAHEIDGVKARPVASV